MSDNTGRQVDSAGPFLTGQVQYGRALSETQRGCFVNENFDRTFHYFRAFAILSVLGAHMWISPEIEGLEDRRQFLECLRSVLFHSSTLYFIFISGYLFDFVYKSRPFDLLRFYKSKVRNLLSPYLFLSLLFIGASMVFEYVPSLQVPYFINHSKAILTLPDAADALLFGKACITYWYMPFIFTVYIVSPLLFHIKGRVFIALVCICSLIPLFIQRGELTDFFCNYGFFYPVFLLGVFFSRYREACLNFIKANVVPIACVAVLTSLLLISDYYDPHLPSQEIGYYIQRLALGALVIHGLEMVTFDIEVLDVLATYSFPLYFLHDLVIYAVQSALFALGLKISPDGMLFVTMFTFCAELLISLALIIAVKNICGKYSRQIIGG